MKDIETELYIYGKRATYETIKDIVEQLEAYRKLGTPEELAELKAENKWLKKRLENSMQLPCKVGDTVYYLSCGEGFLPNKVVGYEIKSLIQIIKLMSEGFFESGVYLTKEAAEARLKELQGESK